MGVRLGRPSGERAGVGFHLGPALRDLDRRVEQATAAVVGGVAGIVSECEVLDDPGLPGLAVKVARGPRRVPGWSVPEPIEGTGVATSADAAERAAIGEVVETYCSYAPPEMERIVRTAALDLGASAVAPARFAWPSPAQYRGLAPLLPLTDDRVVDWCPAWSVTEGRPVLVPAALVYPDIARRSPNDFLPEITSTGLAAHVSPAAAALSGVCEVLERDALAIAWYDRLPLTPIRTQGTEVDELVTGLDGDGVVVELSAVPTDGPFPVTLAVARPNAGPAWAAVGAACRPDPLAAAHKAVAESAQVLLRLEAGGGGSPDEDAAAHYATADGARQLGRCLAKTEGVVSLEELPWPATGDVAQDLASAVEGLRRSGLELVLADLTTADAASAGWRVLRAVVPGAVTTGSQARFAPFAADRLADVPVRLGLRRAPLAEDRLRHLPVPLA
ncbi:MAG TPA: YcaO-like family protein [Acidimicrobiales bacterium]|nr:YcaO-like family protein [Acidimicrobiales bacterium]